LIVGRLWVIFHMFGFGFFEFSTFEVLDLLKRS